MARFLAAIVIVILVASVFAGVYLYAPTGWPFRAPSPVNTDSSVSTETEPVLTPLQQSLKESIEQLEREGRPHPRVFFESTVIAPTPEEREELAESQGSFETKLIATTTIEFDGPEQAGKDRWDDIIIESSSSSDDSGILLQGNFTQLLIDEHPDIYGEGGYQYGEEPRTFVVDEELTTTFIGTREISVLSEGNAASNQTPLSSHVVMGFSFVPDRIDYSINPKWKKLWFTIAEAKAGFIFDAGFGLRLPVRVDVSVSDAATSSDGQPDLVTSITPLNFSAQDYARLGIPPEDGHEFFARMELFLGFKAWFLGRTLVDYSIDVDVDMGEYCLEKVGLDCQDFVTPFGLDENGVQREFPMVMWELSPNDTGLRLHFGVISLGLGLRVDPSLGSDKITAEWVHMGIPERSGEIVYEAAHPVQYPFGPVMGEDVNIGSGSNSHVLMIDNYKFHLNRQTLALLGNVQFEFFGWNIYQTSYKKILEIDLPQMVIGQHSGTFGVMVPLDQIIPLRNNETITEPEIIPVVDYNGTLTVSTNKSEYVTGETVIVSGYSSQTGETLVIQVFNPNGAAYRFDLIPVSDVGADGSYVYSLNVGGPLGVDGTYRVIMIELDQMAETTFSLN